MSTTATATPTATAATPAATTTATTATAATVTPATTTAATATPAKESLSAGGFFMGVWVVYLVIYLIVWMVSGISAFVASFICLGFKGTITDKIIGIVIAMIMGPMYWLYFSLNKDYCVSSSSRPTQMQSF